ncbi:SCP2 sterol-binding domain-containing protein [Planctomycetota bacterium]
MTTCADIFEGMPERFNAEAASDWQTKIQFNIAGEGGGTWVMEVKEGLCTVASGETEDAAAILKTDAVTWVGINTGSADPITAFVTGKIKVEGNMGDVTKLNSPAIFRPAGSQAE